LSRLAAMSSQLPGSYGPTPGSGQTTVGSAAAEGSTGSAGASTDWAVEATDRFETLVNAVRDRTTLPIIKIARLVVYGLVAGVVAIVGVILAVDAFIQIVDAYLPVDPYGRRVWIGYAALGAIFLLVGAFCWSKGNPKPQEKQS
jgi:hypothetical protein